MRIQDMFLKDIERPISGVIKVGQDERENIQQELEEYVVTKEIHRHLQKFYKNYIESIERPTDKIGVWISGFFGSGKSHFLKILSYLLENKEVAGKNAIEYFKDKIEDEDLLAQMERAAQVDTEVILFNIDAKSPMSGKFQKDTLLKIFLKVFYDHQGFYGDSPGIANMEKYLSSQGKYKKFKEEYKKSSGFDWVEDRRTFYFKRDHVVKALSAATGMSEEAAKEWHQHGSKEFNMDIEGLAREIREYLDSKGPDTRLIFLVDEVGQYIGEDSTLMLNLQTIAEELGSQCQGRAWIIVTSQEAIDELTRRIRENDFSKIPGRFDTRLSLSSISVDEVIKKRILEKKDYVEERLKLIYFEKEAILKNLINFEGARSDLVGYRDEDEFALVYPFIPYQFKLLQNVFEQVRKRGSSGKHLSEGERSMLSAFKESAIQFKDEEEGILVPFYAFYETIYEFLSPTITRVIDGAEKNPAFEGDPFSINLLKTLFMVKYIDELPANVDNLAVLMATKIDEDKIALKERIIKSLNKLLNEYLIQKNGDVYIFLTDDEQEINKDIKLTQIDESLIKKELREYLFNQFYDNKRYRYSPHYDFDFNRKMDEVEFGRQTADITINVLSPLSDSYNMPETHLMMQTSGTGEMIIRLDDSKDYLEELKEILKVIEYTRPLNMDLLPPNKQLIINGKKAEERTRRNRVRDNLEYAIKNAHFYVNGEKITPKGSTVKEIINNAMKILTESVYTKLSYINKFITSIDELQGILDKDYEEISIDDNLVDNNALALKEVYEYIKLEDAMNKQIRVKPLLDHFSGKPYGWNELDILGLILTLLKEQKISLKYKGSNLSAANSDLVSIISKPAEQDRIIVTLREEVDEDLIRKVREIIRELWNKTDIREDEDGLGEDLKGLIDDQIDEIEDYLNKYEKKYPGKSLLNKGLEYFEELKSHPDNIVLFKKLVEMEEDLLMWEEDVAYVKSFFKNQRHIFDKGLEAYELYKDNSDYLKDVSVREAYENLKDILEDYLPYRRIKDIPQYVNIINREIDKVLTSKKEESLKQVEEDLDYLLLLTDQPGVKEETKKNIIDLYGGLKRNIEENTEILKIEGIKARSISFREEFEIHISKQVEEYLKLTERETPPRIKERKTKKLRLGELTSIRTIRREEQVDIFLRELEKVLKEEVKNYDIEFID
ncbi:MAG: BREX system P-loop protein BrxC [Tissierellia bacterium]|nr:BREX system P-loop protein BrxC [Tissierellia bacterium]